jgi:methyl-accepting chemotaxis protein
MMNILNFGVYLLDKLTFARKFQLILAMLLMPILYASWAIYNSEMSKINILDRELQGLVTVNKLHPLRIFAAQHRGGTAQWYSGNKNKESSLLGLEDTMAKQFTLLTQDLESDLYNAETLKLLDALKERWSEITFSENADYSARQNFEAHTKWIKKVGSLVDLVINQSDLALDPSLDTYNIMGLVTASIPDVQEMLGRIRGIGSAVATKGSFDAESFIRMQTMFGQLSDTVPIIEQRITIIEQFYPEYSAFYNTEYQRFHTAAKEFQNITKTRLLDPDSPTISGDEYFSEATAVIGYAAELYGVIDKLFAVRLHFYKEKAYTALISLFSVFITLLLISMYLLLCFKRSIDQNVQSVLSMASDLEANTLNSLYTSNSQDELGETIRAMGSAFKKLAGVVSGVRSNSEHLSQSSSSLQDVSTEVNKLCSDQQGKISIIVTAATELAVTAKEVASHCENAELKTQSSKEKALDGAKRSQASALVIRDLAESIRGAGDEISQLAQQAASISTVIDVIKAIAEQTNLLALNAAIEAARAGEQGRGFAVVADEVRTLANRTQQSTNEIETTISNLQQVAEKAVSAMESAREQANSGEQEAISTGDMLANIQTSVNEVSVLIKLVSSAGEQQAIAADEIAQHIQGVDEASLTLVSKAKQVLGIAEDVGSGSHQLNDVMQKFKT